MDYHQYLSILAEKFKKLAQMGAEYSGRFNYEQLWTKHGLWTAEQVGPTIEQLISAAKFTKEGNFNIEISVDEKLNVRYYVVGDLAQKDPQPARRLTIGLLKTFSAKHKQVLVQEKANPVADHWTWFENMQFTE